MCLHSTLPVILSVLHAFVCDNVAIPCLLTDGTLLQDGHTDPQGSPGYNMTSTREGDLTMHLPLLDVSVIVYTNAVARQTVLPYRPRRLPHPSRLCTRLTRS